MSCCRDFFSMSCHNIFPDSSHIRILFSFSQLSPISPTVVAEKVKARVVVKFESWSNSSRGKFFDSNLSQHSPPLASTPTPTYIMSETHTLSQIHLPLTLNCSKQRQPVSSSPLVGLVLIVQLGGTIIFPRYRKRQRVHLLPCPGCHWTLFSKLQTS